MKNPQYAGHAGQGFKKKDRPNTVSTLEARQRTAHGNYMLLI